MAGAGMPNQRTLPQMGVANNQLQPGGIGQPLGLGQAQPQPAPQPPPGLNKPGYQPFADPAPASLYSDPNLGVSGNRVNLGQATAVNQQKAGQNPASLYSDPNLGGGRGIPPRGDGGGMVNGFDQAPNFGLGTGEYSGNTGVTGGMQKYGGSYTDHSMDGRLSEKFFSGSAEEMRGRGIGDGAGMQPPPYSPSSSYYNNTGIAGGRKLPPKPQIDPASLYSDPNMGGGPAQDIRGGGMQDLVSARGRSPSQPQFGQQIRTQGPDNIGGGKPMMRPQQPIQGALGNRNMRQVFNQPVEQRMPPPMMDFGPIQMPRYNPQYETQPIRQSSVAPPRLMSGIGSIGRGRGR